MTENRISLFIFLNTKYTGLTTTWSSYWFLLKTIFQPHRHACVLIPFYHMKTDAPHQYISGNISRNMSKGKSVWKRHSHISAGCILSHDQDSALPLLLGRSCSETLCLQRWFWWGVKRRDTTLGSNLVWNWTDTQPPCSARSSSCGAWAWGWSWVG